jgi:predicted homoserine dehydrogenase-like protein
MFLNQVPTMAGLEVSVIAHLDPERVRDACRTVGWEAPRIARTRFVASGAEACADPGIEVIIEATDNPPAGIAHARATIAAGKHIVMVTVEADVLAGPLLAEEAQANGIV